MKVQNKKQTKPPGWNDDEVYERGSAFTSSFAFTWRTTAAGRGAFTGT